MEDPKAVDEAYFWLHRKANGWPPLPDEFMARWSRLLEPDEDGKVLTICGVPLKELTEAEAKAALALFVSMIS